MKKILFIFLCIALFSNKTFAQTDKTYKVGDVTFKMIFVKGGTFKMGHTLDQGSTCEYFRNNDFRDAELIHKVTLSDYYIGETEVTQALWVAVMGEDPSLSKENGKMPMSNLNWDDCKMFIKRLDSITGVKFRLPTDAEWEFAARGGVKSRSYKYPGSNKLDEVAWCNGTVPNILHEVATKKPNELGIYDMLGNVKEWCNDIWELFPVELAVRPQTNPTGPPEREDKPGEPIVKRVIRGGYWDDGYYNHISVRGWEYHNKKNVDFGFRLAR